MCFTLWIASDIDYIWTWSDKYSDKEIVTIVYYSEILINLSVLLLNDILRILMNEYKELIWNLIKKKETTYLILIKNLKDWDRIIN